MKSINGQIFKNMMISGSNNLYNHYPEIDALNVFPVPDGDTGMNMNLTLSSGSKEIQNRNDDGIYDIAKAFSKGLLMGARGNSGVITSQIFRGFSKACEGKTSLNAVEFAEALVNGKDVAYKAVMKPVEGTILTVIRESSQALLEQVDEDTTIEKAMSILIKEANISLAHTPELLPVLKEVGVVDSGGAGLIKIFDGMESALKGKIIEKSEATATEDKTVVNRELTEEETSGYLLKFTIALVGENKKAFNDKRFLTLLESHGKNAKLNHKGRAVEIEINTNLPGKLLTYAQNYGEFTSLTCENFDKNVLEIAKDLNVEEKPLNEYGLIAVSVGDGLDEMFKEIGANYIVSGGQTMNPSTEDFIEAIKQVHAKNVFILPNNSNIVMAASQACDVIDGDTVARVIPSKTIPQGLVAAISFNPEVDADTNFVEMKSALKNVKSGSITYSIKDTDIDGVHVTKDYYMGIVDKSIVVCEKDKFDTLRDLLDTMVDDDSAIITIIVGEDVSEEEMNNLSEEYSSKYPMIDIDVRKGNQPVYSFLIGVE